MERLKIQESRIRFERLIVWFDDCRLFNSWFVTFRWLPCSSLALKKKKKSMHREISEEKREGEGKASDHQTRDESNRAEATSISITQLQKANEAKP